MTKQILKQAETTFRNLKKLGEILKINPWWKTMPSTHTFDSNPFLKLHWSTAKDLLKALSHIHKNTVREMRATKFWKLEKILVVINSADLASVGKSEKQPDLRQVWQYQV